MDGRLRDEITEREQLKQFADELMAEIEVQHRKRKRDRGDLELKLRRLKDAL